MRMGRSAANSNMSRQVFRMMCYAYIVLGGASILAGGALYAILMFQHNPNPKSMGLLIVVLIGFGLARIGAALFNLRRIPRVQ